MAQGFIHNKRRLLYQKINDLNQKSLLTRNDNMCIHRMFTHGIPGDTNSVIDLSTGDDDTIDQVFQFVSECEKEQEAVISFAREQEALASGAHSRANNSASNLRSFESLLRQYLYHRLDNIESFQAMAHAHNESMKTPNEIKPLAPVLTAAQRNMLKYADARWKRNTCVPRKWDYNKASQVLLPEKEEVVIAVVVADNDAEETDDEISDDEIDDGEEVAIATAEETDDENTDNETDLEDIDSESDCDEIDQS